MEQNLTNLGTNFVRSTGITELDSLLNGGFPRNATVLLAGNSGTGKTVLSMEWLFKGYEYFKEPGLYISLTEPISKSLQNLTRLSFFKKEYVNPTQIYFTDLRIMMEGMDFEERDLTYDDIDKIISSIVHMAKQSGAKRIVLDSITAIAYRLKEKDKIRTFIFKLGTEIGNLDANVMLASEVSDEGYSVFGIEEFISDGIIKLDVEQTKYGWTRTMRIVKMRGISFNQYPARYNITPYGLDIYPRKERILNYNVSYNSLLTGIEGLDKMTNGGIPEGSVTLVSGSSGVGKTILSVEFIFEGLKRNQRCILFTFEESREQIIKNAMNFGWNLIDYEKKGLLKIVSQYPEKAYLEQNLNFIGSQINQFKPQRLIIDSLSSFRNVFSTDELYDFTSRIISHLKSSMVTSLLTNATQNLVGGATVANEELAMLFDNIINLRYVEIESELRHAILIIKVRGRSHDKKMREMIFQKNGISIISDFTGYEGILSGTTRRVSKPIEEQILSLFNDTLGPMGIEMFEEIKLKGLNIVNLESFINNLINDRILPKEKGSRFLLDITNIFNQHE